MAVLIMRWTASAAMSAGPTTRPIGRVDRSWARRSSSPFAEQRGRQRGVDEAGRDQVDPDRRDLKRERRGERRAARRRRRGEGPDAGSDAFTPAAPMNSSVPPARTLPTAFLSHAESMSVA